MELQWRLQQQVAAQQLWQAQMQQAPQVPQSQGSLSHVPQNTQGPLAQQSLQGLADGPDMQQPALLSVQMQQQGPQAHAQQMQQVPQMQQAPLMQPTPQSAQMQQAQASQAHLQQVSQMQQASLMQPGPQRAPHMQQPQNLQAQMQQMPQAHIQQALQAQAQQQHQQQQQQQQIISQQQQGAPRAMPMPLYQTPQALQGQGQGHMMNLWDPSLGLPIGPGGADTVGANCCLFPINLLSCTCINTCAHTH
jgi:hypothetical protein